MRGNTDQLTDEDLQYIIDADCEASWIAEALLETTEMWRDDEETPSPSIAD